MLLRMYYAICGTDIAYAATRRHSSDGYRRCMGIAPPYALCGTALARAATARQPLGGGSRNRRQRTARCALDPRP
eukprot:769676-Rhodomonas_salina.1